MSAVDTSLATITCSDGSFMSGMVTPAALLQLTQDIQALSACTLSAEAPAMATGTKSWTVYDYNPSNQAIAPRNSPNSQPATSSCSGSTCNVSFTFKPGVYTALLTTTDDNMTGDLTLSTLSASGTVGSQAGAFFETQHGGGDCVGNMPAAFRFYFTSARASGPSDPPPGPPQNGLPPAGFYTHFWWSNPIHVDLANGTQPWTMSVQVGNPAMWSDWDGKPAADLLVIDNFLVAIANVKSVGFSFGGDCFFETGVTWTGFPGEAFNTNFSVSPPPQ